MYKQMKERPSYPVILDSMQELSDQDQAMQAIEIILGGTDTSAFTLSMGIFRILGSPECSKKLVASLDEHISRPRLMVPLVELEKIDYLVSLDLCHAPEQPSGIPISLTQTKTSGPLSKNVCASPCQSAEDSHELCLKVLRR